MFEKYCPPMETTTYQQLVLQPGMEIKKKEFNTLSDEEFYESINHIKMQL